MIAVKTRMQIKVLRSPSECIEYSIERKALAALRTAAPHAVSAHFLTCEPTTERDVYAVCVRWFAPLACAGCGAPSTMRTIAHGPLCARCWSNAP